MTDKRNNKRDRTKYGRLKTTSRGLVQVQGGIVELFCGDLRIA